MKGRASGGTGDRSRWKEYNHFIDYASAKLYGAKMSKLDFNDLAYMAQFIFKELREELKESGEAKVLEMIRASEWGIWEKEIAAFESRSKM